MDIVDWHSDDKHTYEEMCSPDSRFNELCALKRLTRSPRTFGFGLPDHTFLFLIPEVVLVWRWLLAYVCVLEPPPPVVMVK